MGSAIYRPKTPLTQTMAAEEALRSYAAGRSGFDYGLARDLELLIAALRSAHNDAKTANHAKSQFLACVSHELRTPLNAIIGFAEMIATEKFGPHPDKRYSDYAKDIMKGARHLSDILGDIIDMASLESGRIKADRHSFELSDLIEEVHALLSSRFKNVMEMLKTNVAPDFPETIWSDKARLRQILTNVLSNALIYTPRGGTVTFSAALVANGDAEIRIVDQGPGMSPADLKRAVTRFGHVEDESSREHQGIGLGLPLAKGLTELLGGEMVIQSSPGEGTTVTLSFPVNTIRNGFNWGKPEDRTAARAKRLLQEDEYILGSERD